jgi:hypothetical protein
LGGSIHSLPFRKETTMEKIATLRIARTIEDSGDLNVQSLHIAFNRMDILRFLFGRKPRIPLYILSDYHKQITVSEDELNEPHEAVV